MHDFMEDPFIIRSDKIKDSHLSRDVRLSWTEEMFEDAGDSSLKLEGGNFQFLGLAITDRKIKIFFLIILLGVSLLFGRSFYLQIIKGSYYHSLAEGNRIRILAIKAHRGVVFDQQGKQLVKNVPSFNLLITPADLPLDGAKRNEILTAVSALAKMPVVDIENLLNQHKPYIYQPILIKSGLNYEETVLATIKEVDWPGVSLEQGSRREYDFTQKGAAPVNSLSHILGYNGQLTKEEYEEYSRQGYFLNDQIGKTGLELTYEKELKGINGQKQVEVDALGREKKIIAQNDPIAGKDLILSLDFDLQKRAEEALAKTLKSTGKKRGAVVILNPQNGEILALVSLPTFDSNNFALGIGGAEYQNLLNNSNKPLFNRAVSGAYPSGSTIKPVMAAAALAEKVITPSTTFNSVGGIKILEWFFPDWKAGGHGLTNVYKAIAESVNTFFYMIGGGFPHNGNPTQNYDFVGLGPERIAVWLNKFGLGKISRVDLNNENEGFVPTVEWKNKTYNEQWYIGDTYNLAIGQGNLLVTPLQVANWTAIIANGGKIYQPHLVKEIGEHEVPLKIVSQDFISDKDLTVVRQGMRDAVNYGSARSFSELPIKIAAKTGTAQWSNNKSPHAWFTCFAPYDQPAIVVTVLIEEGEEGSRTAAAVAKDILWYYATEYKK
jgi:penicillin-binding protein 2